MPNALEIASQGRLEPYDPNFRERLSNALNKYWYGDTRKGQEQANRLLDVLDMSGMVSMGNALAAGPGGNPVNMAMAFVPGPAKKGIRAFHGSPHDFDKFSMDRIGTGEGAQAYGHGLYFAENEPTAKFYRDQLTQTQWPQIALGKTERGYELWDTGSQTLIGTYRTKKEGQKKIDELLRAAEVAKNQGKMYEVSISADPEQFLDWDRPLSEQPELVRNLGSAQKNRPLVDTDTGRDIYNKNTQGLSSDTASQRMREAGIPGIKYLDQGSRGNYTVAKRDGDWGVLRKDGGDFTPWRFADKAKAEAKAKYLNDYERTRNYVVFDDKLIEIIRKYGLAPFALGTLGYGASQQDNTQQ